MSAGQARAGPVTWDELDDVVLLGAEVPNSSRAPDDNPTLIEKATIREAPTADKPLWAICKRMAELPFTCKLYLARLATAALLTWCVSCGGSAAEVRFSGTPDRVVLTMNDATIADILAALRSAFDVEVNLTGGTARRFSGVYSGSVRQVLSRLLTGNDYVLRSGSDGISIRLMGDGTADSPAASSPSPAAPGSRLVALRQGRVKRQGD
jgi:hypothetical protein